MRHYQIVIAMLQENSLKLSFLLFSRQRETRLTELRDPLGSCSYHSFTAEMLWQLVKYEGSYAISK